MYPSHLKISAWAEDDQPREKLMSKGRSNLSDAEILSIILRSGDKGLSAVELSKNILSSVNYDLNELSKMSVLDLMKINGMGPAKSCSIVAAYELNRRRQQMRQNEKPMIKSSKDAFICMKDVFYDLPHEEFWVLALNRGNQVLGRRQISQGGVSGTVADNKIIFKYALENLASSIIVYHNHPSGQMKPSKADEQLTKKIKEGAKNLDIQMLDHLIIHNEEFFSFADEGLL